MSLTCRLAYFVSPAAGLERPGVGKLSLLF